MTRLQINLNFLSTASGLTSQLASIEILLDGNTILAFHDSFPNEDGKGPRIGRYSLDPTEVALKVTIDHATALHKSAETQTDTHYDGTSLQDPGPIFPDSFDDEDTGPGTASTEAAMQAGVDQTSNTLLTEKNIATLQLDGDCERDSAFSGLETYSIQMADLIARNRERKIDAQNQTFPRYLTRPGPLKTKLKMTLAFPPMTDYKCGILFVWKNSIAEKLTHYTVLMDGQDNVGIVDRGDLAFGDKGKSITEDALQALHLHARARKWMMQRPLIIVAESPPTDISCLRGQFGILGPCTSLEEFIASNFPHYGEWLHICRDQILAKMFLSLVFCED